MYSAIDLIRDVWVYVRPRKGRFFVASLLRVASDIAWLYPPYALAIVVEYLSHYTAGMSMTPVYTPIALSFGAIVIRYVGLYFGKNAMFVLSERAALNAQMRAMRHIMMLDTSWHEAENSGNKFKRIDRGADSVDRIIRIWINNIIEIVINLVGVTVILLRFDTKIGVSILVFLAFFYVIAKFFRKRAVAITNIVNAKEENRDGILFEIINNIRSVKVMSMSRKLIDIMASNAEELLSLIRARIFWFQSGFSVRNFCAQVFRLCGITFIIYGISLGYYEIGFLILFVGYFDRAWQSVAELTDISEDLAVAKAAVMRMQSIINTKIVIDDDTGKASFPENWNRISVKGLSFSYKDKAVLDNVTFEINRGEKVGVVGLSGAGKSTLFKLLLKEHETYSGDITIDDKSLRNIKKQDYLKHLAVVLQDTELFNASLRDNVTITNYDRQDDNALFEKSIDIAHVRDFMDKLPNGADSVIGEKGIKLSGGEKQRVGIARAVFKDPEILLLDEATSHLDIESEKTIQDSLHRFFENVTAIVIAHRLTTIKEMDKIIVMQEGKIIETGTFDELIASRGRFAELWERQGL